VRFTDFLGTSTLLFGGAASTLALWTVVSAFSEDDRTLLLLSLGWWAVAAIVGLWLGRGTRPANGISRMLAQAKAATAMPELEPGAILWNRLWPLAAFTVVAGGMGFIFPPVPAVAAGYPLAIALAWRRQSGAVQAIEERDGVQFHVERSPLLGATRLVRTAGLKRFEA
jgi:hypothetical protein